MIAESGLTRRTLGSMAWTGGGVAVEVGLNAVVIMVLARLLTPEHFGIVAIALVVMGFVGIFGELGLSPAVIQRQQLSPAHVRTAFTTSLVLALLVATVVCALAPAVATFFAVPAVAPMIRVLALSLVVRAWGSVPSALLQRAMRFRVIALTNALSYLVGFGVVGVAMAMAGFGAWSLIAAHVVQAYAQSLAFHIAQPVSHRLGVDRRALRDLVSYGSGISFARIANYVALRGDNVVVGHALGPTALGLYAPAYHLMALPAELFQKIVQTALFPAIARLQTEPERLAAAYRRGLAVTGLLAVPGSILTILVAPELVQAVLGPRWSGVTAPLQILAAGMFFRVGYKTSVVFVKAAGPIHEFALRQIPYPLLVLSLAWLGTRWGINGVAGGVVVALGLHYVFLTSLGLRVARLTLRDYCLAHGPALALGVAVLVPAWAAAAAARGLAAPPWVTLGSVALSTGAVIGILVHWMPARVLGAEGIWFRRALASFLSGARAGRAVAWSDTR